MKSLFPKYQDSVYPEIYLAIDNCFASKRYTEPEDWMNLIRDMGIYYVEANADTECDPLYMGRDYLSRWIEKVKGASEKYGVSICNLHSGHGTYSTLGLSHTDKEVRYRILNGWLKPMLETAAILEAGLGFFCHAFSNPVLQNPILYEEYKSELFDNLAEIAEFSLPAGCKKIAIEQMYSPHQIPWTIKGAKELINQVNEKSSIPFYITIDTGHQTGQKKFLKPGKGFLLRAMEQFQKDEQINQLWLGSDSAYKLFERCKYLPKSQYLGLANEIFAKMDDYPYLFSDTNDSSPYSWLEELACYSPIIHLQQTNGTASNHLPFTMTNNETGVIEGGKVLKAIKRAYEKQQGFSIPKADKIYMTIEVFASTASINYDTISQLKETVKYWRKFIPQDGKKIDAMM